MSIRFHVPRRRALLGVLAGLGLLALPTAAFADVVTDWDRTMIEAQAIDNTATPPGTRLAAIVQISVFDAINGIRPEFRAIHVAPAGPASASRGAAAASAAHEALVLEYPAQKAFLDARFAESLGSVGGSQASIDAGVAWGKEVADEVLAWRAHDGSDTVLPPYVAGTAPGDWQPTPPAFLATPAFRVVGVTQPFGMTSTSQFRPPPLPPLASAAYARAFNEVKAFGSATSTARSARGTQTALLWGSDSVVAFWNRVALQVLGRHPRPLVREARIFALLNAAETDGGIMVWEAKAHYDTWRPITAIERAAGDGNPATSPDPNWTPLIPTPPFQEYPSGHAGVSAAGAGILASFFGNRTRFAITSVGLPGVVRNYRSFSQAMADIADARTFGGMHFRFASVASQVAGAKIARYIRQHMALALHH
jgi:membrane-associated phospholipid phosphatase